MRSGLGLSARGVFLVLILTMGAHGQSFVNFETAQVHPVDLNPSRTTLAVCNTPDNRVELFDVQLGTPVPIGSVAVGLDPVSVRFRTDTEAWVVNQLSDSVSVINVATRIVRATLTTGDEPADVIFAGAPERAFVSCSGPDEVQVFNPGNLKQSPARIAIAGESPRALAKSVNGGEVYVAIFRSGNRSTVLGGGLEGMPITLPNVVSDPAGPHGGVNPPPNAGAGFDPPINPALPTPPGVGLIVKKNSAGQWMDDNNGDWTNLVSGQQASKSGRVRNWDVLDNDCAVIDPNLRRIKGYMKGMMNMCMAIGVMPSTGWVSVVGTDATNEIRFEPVLSGTFVRVLGATYSPVSLTGTVSDLNPHLTYASSTIAQEQRDLSIGDPRGIQWNSSGTLVYVTGMGSNNLAIIEPGVRITRLDLGEGPTGIALDETRSRLYVLNRFSAEISVIDTVSEVEETRISLFDPTPGAITTGRKHLYDTHKNSGLGQIACASCHVDGRMDRLAWDLGDPSGEMKSVSDQNLGMNIPGLNTNFTDFHPMKGPMATQTFQDMIGKEPFHWRGDRRGIEEFNPAFMGLQGDDTMLTAIEMQEFEDFLATIHFPPNPNRNLDNTLKTSVPLPGQFASGRFFASGGLRRGAPLPPGNAQRGLRLYMGTEAPNNSLDGVLNCVTCHALPTGAGADSFLNLSTLQFEPFPVGPDGNHHAALVSVDGSTQRAIKTAHLRNGNDKVGMDLTHAVSRSGFGYLHDGTVDSLATFLSSTVFDVRNDQDVADLVALMLSFSGSDFGNPATMPVPGLPEEPPSFQVSNDAHAGVGRQVTINTPAPDFTIITQIIDQASVGAIEAVVRGKKAGVARGWVYLSGGGEVDTVWQSDLAGETATGTELLNLAAPGNEITLTAVPIGTGTRIGIDRDEDGVLDGNENAATTISVHSPSGVESWQKGTSHVVTWSSTGITGNVTIHLYLNGVWNRQLSTGVAASAQSWTWVIPADLVAGPGYQALVNQGPTIWGASAAPFVITN